MPIYNQWEEQFRSAQMQLNPLYAAAEKEQFNPLYNDNDKTMDPSFADTSRNALNNNNTSMKAVPMGSTPTTNGRIFDAVEFSTQDYRNKTS